MCTSPVQAAQVRRSGSPQRHRFGWDCALCPSQVRVVWQARSPRLVTFSAAAAQLSGWTAGAPCEADCDCPAPPEVLAKKPACSLVSEVSPGLQLPLSSPYGSGCLSPAGDGRQLAISIPSFVLCVVLEVSYVRAFHVVAIPQSGLLAQVRSFWLRVGRSCPILTKLTVILTCEISKNYYFI